MKGNSHDIFDYFMYCDYFTNSDYLINCDYYYSVLLCFKNAFMYICAMPSNAFLMASGFL